MRSELKKKLFSLFLILVAQLAASITYAQDIPIPVTWGVQVEDGVTIHAENLYIVANQNDPASMQLAQEYAEARKIPLGNVITVALPVRIEISATEAAPLALAINNAAAAKGFVLAWSMPYRVGPNQSITSFVSMGAASPTQFTQTCNITTMSSYFGTGPLVGKGTVFSQSTLKPSMLLASYSSYSPASANGAVKTISDPSKLTPPLVLAEYLEGIRATIQRGVAADYRWYAGIAYYLKTSDVNRSVRYADMQRAASIFGTYLSGRYLQQNALAGKSDILIYQTGLATLDPTGGGTNTYLPGAVADTLTSYSGRLYDSGTQISALEFLRAGATASYGTVREPCNYVQKFPKASVLKSHLVAGDSLLEAYWKSVQWPTEGLFIGEPLARPYSRIRATYNNGELYLANSGGVDGYYDIFYNDIVVASSVLLKQNASTQTNIGSVNFNGKALLKAVLTARAN